MTHEASSTVLPLVYVIGDSISIQYGPYLESALQGSFRYDRKSGEAEALLNLDIPVGANAGDSCRVVDFLEATLSTGSFRPDILLVNCGLHDIKRNPQTREIQVPIELYRANLQRIATLCREAGLRLVWVRSTPVVDAIHDRHCQGFHRFAEDLEAYNACADAVMADAGVEVLDLYEFTRSLGKDADLFCDHVHYTDAVRQKQGSYLAECLGRLAG